MAAGILDGLRIVELSAFVAVPLAGGTLASLGAEVIRIDPVGGSIDANRTPTWQGRSLYWAGLNHGKRSIAVDLRAEAGQDLVRRLVAGGGEGGGIVITNLGARGWSGYERLRQVRPDLIMVVLSGNPDGSQAVDYTVNARIGFPLVTGPPDRDEPVNHVLPAWDAQAGYLVALAVLAAERHRARTGEGQLVELSLFDVGLALAGRLGILAEAALVPEARPRYGNYVYGTFGKDFATADGRRVILMALTPRQWRSVVEATGLADSFAALAGELGVDFDREEARWEHREALAERIAAWARSRPLAEVAAAFDAAGVLWAAYRNFQQLVAEDRDATPANPVLTEVSEEGVGDYLLARAPVRFGSHPAPPAGQPPRQGVDTEPVLRELLGLDEAAIARLREAGVIQ